MPKAEAKSQAAAKAEARSQAAAKPRPTDPMIYNIILLEKLSIHCLWPSRAGNT